MDTVKVTFGKNGLLKKPDWAEFYVGLKHKTSAAVAGLTRQYLTFPDGASKVTVTQEENEGGLKIEGQPNQVDLDLV